MSRFRRIVHSAATGYVSLITASVYSLASVPLALHYLSPARFGLWFLMTDISNYLGLIDLGMSAALARTLIDHKDERGSGAYGSLLKTGWLVMTVQGLIILLVGYVLAPALSGLLRIPDALVPDFVAMVRWQATTLAFSFTIRVFSYMLQAHQQTHLINYTEIGRLSAGFFVLWGFFHAGYGVFSLVWTNMLSAVAGAAVMFAQCCRLRLFPPPGAWGRVSGRHFRELFAYGKDIFLVGVGAQLILASQRMIISRRLGLEAVTMWGIGTRMFSLVSQIIWRAFDVSGPALAEMIVRGERELLRERYRSLVIATASLAGVAAIGYALCNHPFVTIWTHHRMNWPSANDALMAVWLLLMTIVHCHNCFVLLTKKTRAMPYVYFAEGLAFVVCAFLTIRWGGFPAMIVCSMVCSTAFSGAYGVWRVSDYFKLPIREVALGWLAPMARVLLLLAPMAVALWWSLQGVADPFMRLMAGVLLTGLPGAYFYLRFGLSRAIQQELLERMPKAVNPVLRRIFPVSAS